VQQQLVHLVPEAGRLGQGRFTFRDQQIQHGGVIIRDDLGSR
jgi:hypothetical protein